MAPSFGLAVRPGDAVGELGGVGERGVDVGALQVWECCEQVINRIAGGKGADDLGDRYARARDARPAVQDSGIGLDAAGRRSLLLAF